MLEICGQTPGPLRADECLWLFETAAAVRPGGHWCEVGFGPHQAFLAAGLGLPDNSALTCVIHPLAGLQPLRPNDALMEQCNRNLRRLQELRSDLRIQIVTAHPQDAVLAMENETIDVVFLQACRDPKWISDQLAVWRPKICASGRLSGHGMGRLEWPGVTPAVAESLPGVSSGAGTIWSWTSSPPFDDSSPLPRLSVIVATTGRASLAKTLASIRSQRLLEGDEVLLVHDGEPGIQAIIAWDQARLPGQMLVLATGPHHDWGAAARSAGQVRACGSHLLWQDDDDVYLPGAFDLIRREIVASPEDILLFRLAYPSGRLLWRVPIIQCRNVSTQMYVVPRAAQLGKWGTHYQGDFEFIETTVAANPGRPVRFVDKPTVMYSRAL